MYKIHYIDALTSERYVHQWPHSNKVDHLLFILFGGNWACDCNRFDDLVRCGGKDVADDYEAPCSEDGNRYIIERVETMDGKEIPLTKSPLDQCAPKLVPNLEGYLRQPVSA